MHQELHEWRTPHMRLVCAVTFSWPQTAGSKPQADIQFVSNRAKEGQEFNLHPARAALVTHPTEYGELKLQRLESVLVFRLGLGFG